MNAPALPDDALLSQLGSPRPTGWRRAIPGVRLGLLLALAAGGVWVARGRTTTAAPVKYLTQPVTRGDLVAAVTATGTLRGKDTVSIGAETSGRVKAVHVDFNDAVKAGQLLVEIDPEQSTAALAQASAQLAAARAEVKNREATLGEARLAAERARSLAGDGLASRQQLESAVAAADRAVAAAEAARAQVTVAEATLHSAQTALGKTMIRSPLDGVVLSRDVEPGQALAAAMSTPVLLRVARDLRVMELTVSIDEADIGQIRLGQRATFTVDAWPGRTFPGELAAVHNVAVTKDNVVTYEALVRVANDDLALRPGMTATVTIEADARHDVLRVPNAALRFRPPRAAPRAALGTPPGSEGAVVSDTRPRLYVLRQGVAEEQPVELGLSDGVSTEVRAARLSPGDLAIVDAEQGGAR